MCGWRGAGGGEDGGEVLDGVEADILRVRMMGFGGGVVRGDVEGRCSALGLLER